MIELCARHWARVSAQFPAPAYEPREQDTLTTWAAGALRETGLRQKLDAAESVAQHCDLDTFDRARRLSMAIDATHHALLCAGHFEQLVRFFVALSSRDAQYLVDCAEVGGMTPVEYADKFRTWSPELGAEFVASAEGERAAFARGERSPLNHSRDVASADRAFAGT
jgi:hypothetical protein